MRACTTATFDAEARLDLSQFDRPSLDISIAQAVALAATAFLTPSMVEVSGSDDFDQPARQGLPIGTIRIAIVLIARLEQTYFSLSRCCGFEDGGCVRVVEVDK
jgi:hypothetical protein